MCYRRFDSEEMVDRIYDTLAADFGEAAIFRDINTIPPGVDFPTYIQGSLRDCPVTLVFIGREWVTCTDERGRRRIDDPGDHVRIEVETALALPGARVIPIFVRHATVPGEDELPESLRPLRRRNGITVRGSGTDYRHDIAHLSKVLEDAVKKVLSARHATAEPAIPLTPTKGVPVIAPTHPRPRSHSQPVPKPASLAVTLTTATKDAPFENSLGMKCVPVEITGGSADGKRLLFSIWDTRVSDWEAFIQEEGDTAQWGLYGLDKMEVKWGVKKELSWKNPGFEQTSQHPVVGVSWEDAHRFCAWLSKKEGRTYRLPTDAEWSAAVGSQTYPWGNKFPPPNGAGNYCGSESQLNTDASGTTAWATIEGYNDGFPRTSPVGSFAANRLSLYDMGGNVWQWCEDDYKASMNSAEAIKAVTGLKEEKASDGTPYRVLRGASWFDYDEFYLLSTFRNFDFSTNRYDNYGFRCVLVISGG